jgi:MFS transporter, DHA3 family, tetracycline resistance protein
VTTPARAFYAHNLAGAFTSGVIYTALYVYFVRVVGLGLFELSLIGVLLMLASLLFETPTGVVADVYSRKLSVVIGGALTGACFLIIGLVPVAWVVFAAALLNAIGDTFVSGALEAWLTDEVAHAGGDAARVSAIIIRAEQTGSPAHWLGIGSSVLLSTVFGPGSAVAFGGGVLLVASLVLFRVMPERGFTRQAPDERGSLREQMRVALRTFADGARLVRGTPALRLLFAAAFFYGAFFEPFFRLYQAHMLTAFGLPAIVLPGIGPLSETIWFGMLDAAVTLLYLPASILQRRGTAGEAGHERTIARMLTIGFGVALFAAAIFALTGTLWPAIGAYLVIRVVLILAEPLIVAWRNRHIPSEIRATVLSMNSQLNVLGQLGGGLGVGALGARVGTRAALALATMFLIPVIALYAARGALASDPSD